MDVLTQARGAGYETVQYNMACSGLPSLPPVIAPDVVSAIRSATRDTGVGIAALSATYNMIHPDASVRATGHESLSVLAETAHVLGIPMLTLCSGSRNAADQWAPHRDNANAESWRDLLDSLARAIAVAEQHDVLLGVEPEPSNVVSSSAVARRLLDESGSARVGIIIDAANLIGDALRYPALERHAVIARAVDLLADRVILVHAKDRRIDGTIAAPGHGDVDFVEYFSALANAGVRVPVITHGLTAADAPQAAVFLRGCMMPPGRS
ncbi:MAG: sugar phosphate isomerase/epimerase [Gemmatimonadaceae bacterium]|nr:sugar phosphate isomerase/epimerase [Gemmatimonadaceae bacterium]